MRIALAAVFLGIACILLALDVDPVPTWFYVFAWYPILFAADAVVARRPNREGWLTHPGRAASLLGWSIVIWMVYEVLNFRIQNWYYVFLPAWQPERWIGITVSFATVIPAIVIGEQILATQSTAPAVSGRRFPSRPWHLHASVVLGIMLVVLAVAWPRVFSPFVWGAGLLIADPLVYRRCPDASLLRDAEHGRWSRIGRLVLAGVFVGFLWESLNYWARAKWVYTVPHLEAVKWFEMPPFGFVGFPVFALSAWSIYHALCALGWGVPIYGQATIRRAQLSVVAPIALGFCLVALWGMDRMTVSSVSPRLAALAEGRASSSIHQRLVEQGIENPYQLASSDPVALATATGLAPDHARRLVETARLATARGIGVHHTQTLAGSGISNLCDLARANAAQLWLDIHTPSRAARPTQAEVRVWVRAAQRRCPNA